MLSESFEFNSITRHCYSGYALASVHTQQGIIEKFSGNWQSVNNAIWTVDTIVNDWELGVELGTPSDYDRLKASYDEQKAQLISCTGYGLPGDADG